VAALVDYVAQSEAGAGPALSAPPVSELSERLELRRLLRDGGLTVDSFEPWLRTLLAHTTRLHHPGELAHQVAVPDVPAALGDLLHGAANQPKSI
jgi:L-2,4-diaminobutyrate decarboxylase